MDNASKEVERWQGVIADLTKQGETAEGRIEKLRERKRPLSLRAHTGDEKAREKLGALNAELLTERQGLEDLVEAVAQAEAEFAKAQEALAVDQEADRLRLLSGLATERVKAAAVVDQQAQALASYFGIGDKIYRHIGSGDVSFGAKVRSTGRADGAVAHHLASFLGCITRIPKDSRDGPTLEAMEEEQLAILLINPDKADEIAGMNPAGNPTGELERSAA